MDSLKFQVVHLVPTIDVLGIFEVGPHLILTVDMIESFDSTSNRMFFFQMLGTTITYMLIMRQEENWAALEHKW